MKPWITRFSKLNTLRNQILFAFVLVMVIVLFLVGIINYNLVSSLIKNNAEKQIQKTAVEANGRLETLYKQIDTLTHQVATNTYVQQLLLDIVEGGSATFNERQALTQIVNRTQVYSDGINAFELYMTNYHRLFPLDEEDLNHRLAMTWLELADEAKGRMVWIGVDPKDESYFLAIRRISLIDRWFSHGGYLLTRINRNYFQFDEPFDLSEANEYMMLLDPDMSPIMTNYEGTLNPLLWDGESTVTINDDDYLVVKQSSDLTGWTLVIMSPVHNLTKGISVLRTAIIISGVIGCLLFLVLSLFLSTMMTRPILRLIKTMRSARLGMLKPTPGISSTMEINELNKTYNQMVENINHLIQVVYEKELIRSRSELKALQAQINPHFLYNTLEALYWSLQDKDEEELASLVIAMSELFRYTIGNPKKDEWVTIEEELEHIERYMQIMKMRFGDRLTWEVSASKECYDVKIPKLLIQPLVENAILHGVGNKNGEGSISVKVQQLASSPNLWIEIKDDGPGMDPSTIQAILQSANSDEYLSERGHGMAIANVNKRLQMYGDNAGQGLSIESQLGKGTCVIFEIPSNGGA